MLGETEKRKNRGRKREGWKREWSEKEVMTGGDGGERERDRRGRGARENRQGR